MLPGITTFLRNTFDENLKKLVQPAGLVVAAVFLILNLLFISPVLRDQNNIIATTFLGWDEGWQLVVASALVVVLSYLLLSFTATILKLMTGELWANSPVIGTFLVSRQEEHVKSGREELAYATSEAPGQYDKESAEKALAAAEKALQDLKDESSTRRAKLVEVNTLLEVTQAAYREESRKVTEIKGRFVVVRTDEGRAELDRQLAERTQEQRQAADQLTKAQGDKVELESYLQQLATRQTEARAEIEQYQERLNSVLRANAEQSRIAWERITTYPREIGHTAPTALGNVIEAVSSYVWAHYRIDMIALWPHMERVAFKNKEDGIADRIDGEKTTLDFLVNLSFVLAFFAVEYLLFFIFWIKQGPALAVVLLLVLAAYVVYRAAVSRARTWGDAVQLAFDMYGKKLRDAMELREFATRSAQREAYEKLSRWLLWGDVTEARTWDELFDVPPEPPQTEPVVESSPNVKATISYGLTQFDGQVSDNELPNMYVHYKEEREYSILLSNVPEKDGDVTYLANGVYATATDPLMPIIIDTPVAQQDDWPGAEPPTATIVRTHKEANIYSLLWRIKQLPPNSARMIRYKVRVPLLYARTNHQDLRIDAEVKRADPDDDNVIKYSYQLCISNSGATAQQVILDLYYDRDFFLGEPSELSLIKNDQETRESLQANKEEIESQMTPKLAPPPTYSWSLGELAASQGKWALSFILSSNAQEEGT